MFESIGNFFKKMVKLNEIKLNIIYIKRIAQSMMQKKDYTWF